MKPLAFPVLGILAALLPVASQALDIRGYTPERHDRFTGFPTAPAVNSGAWFDSSAYSAVGWSVSDPRRQFALVSPRHFLSASHWPLSPGEVISFLAPDGQIVSRTVESTTVVNRDGHGTDLTLGRFTEEIPAATGILPFPYLRFATEAEYNGHPLQVFGFNAKVGGSSFVGFSGLDVGTGSTRMIWYTYDAEATGQDDCHFAVGDSNSPTFGTMNGKPALVGLHSALIVSSDSRYYYNYDIAVPWYVPQLDALLAADGWRMIPSDQTATTLAVSANVPTNAMIQTQPGSAGFVVQNPAVAADGNLTVTLEFPAGAAPASVTGDGWVTVQNGPQIWTFRRQTLGAQSSVTLTASWPVVPSVSAFEVFATTDSDGDQSRTTVLTLSPQAKKGKGGRH